MHNRDKPFTPGKITLLTILLSSMVILMGAAAVAPALQPIKQHFGESEFMVSLIVSLPSLSVAITGFGVGYLADKLGKVKVFFLAMAIFTITGTASFFLANFPLILVCRFILGIGIAGISLTITALIGEYYAGMQRAKVIGYQAAAIGVGTLVLETLGGSLADVGWNYPFLIYLIGIPIFIFGILSVRDPSRIVRDPSQSMPLQDTPADNGGRKKILFCYAMVFLEMFLMFTVPMNFSYYIAEMDQPYVMMGILLGLMGVAQAVFSILYTRRATKLTDGMAFTCAFLMMGASLIMLYIPFLPLTFVSMIVMGCSLGLLMPTVIARLSMLSTVKTSGKVMGGYSVFLNLSNFITTLVFTPVLAVMGSYCNSYLAMGVLGLIVAVAVFISSARKTSGTSSAPRPAALPEHPADMPSMYRSVLVATDGSENSEFAVKNAVNIAKKNNAALTVLFVLDPSNLSGLAGALDTSENIAGAAKEDSAEAFRKAVELGTSAGIEVTTKILQGHPADMIAEESANHDLCVCGSLGRTNAKRVVIGSVAEKVVRSAYCPVLVCRKNQQ
jgi:nucleotide-binding universal stress UspA family protein/predicted MFS family arabinose efflux permease